MHSKKLISGGGGQPSTLRFVDVQEIRDGVVLLRNGSLRAILGVSSVNFDLKSTSEQEGIILQFQGFLNSLDFPTQFLVTSRRLNIQPYLETLSKYESGQTNELLRIQMAEYKEFIENLTKVSNIMSKRFYVVVPFFPIETNKQSFFDALSSIVNPQKAVVYKNELFETYKNQLFQRVEHVSAGLSGTGLRMILLKTEEVIELLHNSYNPNLFATDILKGIESVDVKI